MRPRTSVPVAYLLAIAFTSFPPTTRAGGPIPNDPDFSYQWGLRNTGQVVDDQAGKPGADVSALAGWSIHSGARPIIVAVVGTGVDPHPEFADRLLEGFVAPSAGGDPYNTLDTFNHGTRVAGIIAAARNNAAGIAGLNDHVWVLPIRVLQGPVGTEASVAEGIRQAVDAAADVIVVPLQFYDGTMALADAVTYAAAHDVVVVAPAGHNADSTVAYPAAFEGCLAVAATDNLDEPAGFSNSGEQVDLSAPSAGIWSTQAGGGLGFETAPSSAWAAGYVAGVASLIRSFAPQLSAAQVGEILRASADDLGDGGWDARFGAGRVNAARALQLTPLPALRFDFDAPFPQVIPPNTPTPLLVRFAEGAEEVQSASLVYRSVVAGTPTEVPLEALGGGSYRAMLPATPCEATLEYYLRAVGSGGSEVREPLNAPNVWHSALAVQTLDLFADDFETALGWTTEIEGAATMGGWTRVVPVGTTAQPGYDFSTDAGRTCFVTGQHYGGHDGTNDVDGGPVSLLSPVIPLTAADAEVSYARWFYSDIGVTDSLVVEMSRDGGGTWTTVETVEETSRWSLHRFRLRDFPDVAGDSLRLRFRTSDLTLDSLTEAAVDEVRVRAILCSSVRGDADGDGDLDLFDYRRSMGCWNGPHVAPESLDCRAFDFEPDGDVDLVDFGELQNRFQSVGEAGP